MKIVIDDKIPFIRRVLEDFAEVEYTAGSKITATQIRDADALIIRTRTICNQELLEDSKVKFIGTATIGIDHIDTNWCDANKVNWTNAPGCNADSVEQYVTAALLYWAKMKNRNLSELCIGVVGVGQVGSRVAKTCEILGMKVLLNDPPRERIEGSALFTDINAIKKEADIITFHVPLNKSELDKTYHMLDEEFISSLKNGVLLFNTCRGEVFDTKALVEAIEKKRIENPVIDCWENEPNIDSKLFLNSFIATPHIAGYSKDGKANGTQQIIRALAKEFDLPLQDWEATGIPDPENNLIQIDPAGKNEQEIISEAVLYTYPIWEDDQRLRSSPESFEKQRGNYPIRREFTTYRIEIKNRNKHQIQILKKIGFAISMVR